MDGSQRVDITEGHNLVVLVKRIDGKLAGHDTAENALHELTLLPSVFSFALLEYVIPINVIGHNGREVIHR